jgi:hypothetical protein
MRDHLDASINQMNASFKQVSNNFNHLNSSMRDHLDASINQMRAENNASFNQIINLLTPIVASTKVLCRCAMEFDYHNKAKLAARSSTPTANATGTVFRIAVDGIEEGIELAGTEYALTASRGASGKLDSLCLHLGRA